MQSLQLLSSIVYYLLHGEQCHSNAVINLQNAFPMRSSDIVPGYVLCFVATCPRRSAAFISASPRSTYSIIQQGKVGGSTVGL